MKKVLIQVNGIGLLVKPRVLPADILSMVGKPNPYYRLYSIDAKSNADWVEPYREINVREGEHFVVRYG